MELTFVIVCRLFKWKQICTGFLCMYWRSNNQRVESWAPINGLSLPHFCDCPKPGPGYPRSYVVVLYV
jgi:hypothetical protein